MTRYHDHFASECVCSGSGMVEVWITPQMRTLLGNPITVAESTVVACKCERGEALNQTRRTDHPEYGDMRYPVFNPETMQSVKSGPPAERFQQQTLPGGF